MISLANDNVTPVDTNALEAQGYGRLNAIRIRYTEDGAVLEQLWVSSGQPDVWAAVPYIESSEEP